MKNNTPAQGGASTIAAKVLNRAIDLEVARRNLNPASLLIAPPDLREYLKVLALYAASLQEAVAALNYDLKRERGDQ